MAVKQPVRLAYNLLGLDSTQLGAEGPCALFSSISQMPRRLGERSLNKIEAYGLQSGLDILQQSVVKIHPFAAPQSWSAKQLVYAETSP
jgi:hypothetical protein